MDEHEEFEELIDALRRGGLNIPDLVEDMHGLVLAVKANGRMVRANQDDDDEDDSEMGDDDEYTSHADPIQLGLPDPAAPYREQIRQHGDAKFARDWDRTLGRKPKAKANGSK
jgi:hypothetical protein